MLIKNRDLSVKAKLRANTHQKQQEPEHEAYYPLEHRQHEQIAQLVTSFAPRVEVHSIQDEFASIPENERYFNYHLKLSAAVGEGEEGEYFLGNWRLHFKSRTFCSICLEEIREHEKRAIPKHVNSQTKVHRHLGT